MTNATAQAPFASSAEPSPTLRRELGKWDLTAIGINQVIGSAVFFLPSQVAAQVGSWSPLAFVVIGFASLLVALCFAEVGSRFDRTGGPYLYTRAAFGRFIGFEVGWMQWVSVSRVRRASSMRLHWLWASTGRLSRPALAGWRSLPASL
jgi:amino acid permease